MGLLPSRPRHTARERSSLARFLGPARLPVAILLAAVVGAQRVPRGLRPPGAVELPAARRRRARAERRTFALGFLALGLGGAVLGGELARVWRRGSAPLPSETDHVGVAAGEAVRETVEVAVEGYRQATHTETALLNMLASFTTAFGIVRASTHAIRARGAFGPFRNVSVGDDHIHHFVPGILVAFMSGGAAVLVNDERLDPWLAIPFGVGVALTLDESALLLKLDDVYWSEEGIVSVQITLTALAMLSAALIALRVLRRGEERVLDAPDLPPPAFDA
jgi:hypothetical protein